MKLYMCNFNVSFCKAFYLETLIISDMKLSQSEFSLYHPQY